MQSEDRARRPAGFPRRQGALQRLRGSIRRTSHQSWRDPDPGLRALVFSHDSELILLGGGSLSNLFVPLLCERLHIKQ